VKNLTTSYEIYTELLACFLAMNDQVLRTCSAPSDTNNITKAECHYSCYIVSCCQADM